MSNEPGFLAGKKRERGGGDGRGGGVGRGGKRKGRGGGGNGARIQVGFVLKQAPKKEIISLLDRDRGSEVLKSSRKNGAGGGGSKVLWDHAIHHPC